MKIKGFDAVDLIKNSLIVIAGTAIPAFGVALFLLPFELVSGGATGLAIIITHLLPSDTVSADTVIAALSWLLFLVGAFTLGRDFAYKTGLSTLVYPIFVGLFTRVISSEFFRGYFMLSEGYLGASSILLASVFGGVFVGVGISLTVLGGGSTGGSDVIALILASKIKRLKSSTAVFITDATIVLLGVFAIADLVKSLLGVVTALVCATVIDRLVLGGKRAVSAEIITEHHGRIIESVSKSFGRTVTLVPCIYGGSDKHKSLKVTLSLREYPKLIALVSELDSEATVTAYKVHEIKEKDS